MNAQSTPPPSSDPDAMEAPNLAISPEKVSYIIIKAREFDAKDVVTDPDSASNASDDAMLSVLEDHSDDPVIMELRAAIGGLNEDEQIDLVTLTWLGRGDGDVEDWADSAGRGGACPQQPHRVLSARDPIVIRLSAGRAVAARDFHRGIRERAPLRHH